MKLKSVSTLSILAVCLLLQGCSEDKGLPHKANTNSVKSKEMSSNIDAKKDEQLQTFANDQGESLNLGNAQHEPGTEIIGGKPPSSPTHTFDKPEASVNIDGVTFRIRNDNIFTGLNFNSDQISLSNYKPISSSPAPSLQLGNHRQQRPNDGVNHAERLSQIIIKRELIRDAIADINVALSSCQSEVQCYLDNESTLNSLLKHFKDLTSDYVTIFKEDELTEDIQTLTKNLSPLSDVVKDRNEIQIVINRIAINFGHELIESELDNEFVWKLKKVQINPKDLDAYIEKFHEEPIGQEVEWNIHLFKLNDGTYGFSNNLSKQLLYQEIKTLKQSVDVFGKKYKSHMSLETLAKWRSIATRVREIVIAITDNEAALP